MALVLEHPLAVLLWIVDGALLATVVSVLWSARARARARRSRITLAQEDGMSSTIYPTRHGHEVRLAVGHNALHGEGGPYVSLTSEGSYARFQATLTAREAYELAVALWESAARLEVATGLYSEDVPPPPWDSAA